MKKKLLIVSGVLALAFAPLASAQSFTDLTNGLDTFATEAPAALPFAAGAGIDWSNAYIGQLLDTDFPFVHFGVGFTGGATTMPGKAINPLLKAVGESPIDILPLPFAVVNARIGGVLLPFDVGVKVGFLPESLKKVDSYTFDYQNFGIDFRYNLLKSDLVMPDISVGGGINYLKAAVSAQVGSAQNFSDGTYNLNITAPTLSLDMSSLEFEGKVQVSKTLLWILTPYVGLTASVGSATAKSGIGATVSSTAPSYSYWLDNYGIAVTNQGFSKSKDAATFGVKLYGGTSVNVFILKLDVQGMYNVTDGALGFAAGLRAQL